MKRFVNRSIFATVLMFSTNFVFAQESDEQKAINEMTYAFGVAQTQGLKEYLASSLNVDLDYFSSFVKGLNTGAEQAKDKEKNAYFAGIQIGIQIANRMIPGINKEVFGDSINIRVPLDVFMKGFNHGLNASDEELASVTENAPELLRKVKELQMLKKYSANKVAGEKFLEQNKKKAGVKQLPSGLQYKVLKKGRGRIPDSSDYVKVHYEGRSIDGAIFDSSREQGGPVVFKADELILGFTEALTHMPVGSVWEVYIPQNLAYAEREQGEIKPFSVLIYDIELLSIEQNGEK